MHGLIRPRLTACGFALASAKERLRNNFPSFRSTAIVGDAASVASLPARTTLAASPTKHANREVISPPFLSSKRKTALPKDHGMIEQLHHRGWHYLLLIVISGLMFFLNLGGASLWDLDEGRNSECAYEMMEANNWIIPTFNSQLRVDKPVLLYWLQIFSYTAFGVNEFAARFPSALAALLTVLLAYELARSMFSRTTGLLAGVIVASTPMLCGAGRFANPDALLNCFTVLTLTVFWIGLDQRRWWWFLLLGVSSGLAVLAKGPVGLVLPSAVTTLFLVWERQLGVVWDRRWFNACWAFILTAVPWYLWVGLETHGEFLSGFFWKHNVARGLSAMENHQGFPGYYLVVLIVGTTPWSIFLGLAWWFGIWSTIRCPWVICESRWSQASEVGDSEITDSLTDRPAAYRLLTCWLLVYVLFFSVAATKLPNYVLPTVVPCGIFIARFLQRWRTGTLQVPTWLIYTWVPTLLLIGILVGLGLTIAAGVGEVSLLRGRYLPGLENWAFLGAIPIAAAAACWWFARARQYSRFIVAIAVTAILLIVPLAAFGSVVFNRFKAPQVLVERSDTARRNEDIRIGCWQLEHLPSLNFYLKRNVEHLQDENALANFLQSQLPVYVFIPLDDWQRLESKTGGSARIVGRQYDLYHHTEVVVVTNR
jgi:4-amino-4-deoxy-L-arabinose transferase-like glycosyltransferase